MSNNLDPTTLCIAPQPHNARHSRMNRRLQPAARSFDALLIGAIVCALGCSSKPAPPAASAAKPAATPQPAVMDSAARAHYAQMAAQHPTSKVFLQSTERPTILVVPENTTDDQLTDLLWYLRTEVQSGHFKQLGLKPTTTVFGVPGYSRGVLNIYRGEKCAREMYTTSGPDPCGSSIHKSATYHWGDAGDSHADGADIVTQNGTDKTVFTSEDGWQTEEEARVDPNGQLRRAARARVQYSIRQNADQTKQGSQYRFAVTQPDTTLRVVSYLLANDAGQKSFFDQFWTLEDDHLCALGFKALELGPEGKPGKTYPIQCAAAKGAA